MFAFCGKALCVCYVYANVSESEEDAAVCLYDRSVFIFFPPINITPSQRFGACGSQEIIHVERRKIGSVCICGERIYGKRSQK